MRYNRQQNKSFTSSGSECVAMEQLRYPSSASEHCGSSSSAFSYVDCAFDVWPIPENWKQVSLSYQYFDIDVYRVNNSIN